MAVQEGEAKVKSARDLEERLRARMAEADNREVTDTMLYYISPIECPGLYGGLDYCLVFSVLKRYCYLKNCPAAVKRRQEFFSLFPRSCRVLSCLSADELGCKCIVHACDR